MKLPAREYQHYVGIDPGHKGGFAMMDAAASYVRVWPMPWGEDELDLAGLKVQFEKFAGCDVAIGIEWPVAWPHAFANVVRDAEIFGRQKGYLEAFAYLMGLDHFRISPQLWINRLGLGGKGLTGDQHRAEIERRASLYDLYYPEHTQLIRGPKGGIQDGVLDAALICHFLRTSGSGMRHVAQKFGKDSVQSLAFVLGSGRRKLKMKSLPRYKS